MRSMASGRPLKIVLDTNVVLDWLVFRDPALALIEKRLQAGLIEIITNVTATEELRRVLAYPRLALDPAAQATVLRTYGQYAVVATLAPCVPPAGFPRCRDSDDQPFLDLAHRTNARALVSRDNELLRLKKRARDFGIDIVNIDSFVELLEHSGFPASGFLA